MDSIRKLLFAILLITTMTTRSHSVDAGSGCLNVRDFGAKGDGVTDDTKAIQAAFDAAAKQITGGRWEATGKFKDLYGGLGMPYRTGPEVLFPAGRYKVSETLNINVKSICGTGDPIIELSDPRKDIFYFPHSWQVTIKGITFLGGRTQLNLGNPNVDKSQIVIEKCKFYHSTGPAIITRKGSNSTLLTVKDCLFAICRQALVSNCDWTVMRDTWISTDPEMDNMAVIENHHGVMTIDNLLGVPYCYGTDQRWIDNYGSLHIKQSRFGGEGGGFTPVVNFAKFIPHTLSNLIVIEGSWLSALSNFKRLAAVYCEEVPNGIEIRNCNLAGIPPFKLAKKIDLKTYFAGAKPGMLSFSVSGCAGVMADKMPALLKKPILINKIEGQLTKADTSRALARAIKEVQAKAYPGMPPGEWNGHKEQTDPQRYLDITMRKNDWDLDDDMDGTADRNGEYLAMGQAADMMVIMRRVPAGGVVLTSGQNWPHVLIKDVKVDLDKYPYLSWKIGNAKDGSPNSHAVRIIDKETGTMVLVVDQGNHHGIEYQAYNVKEKLGLSGIRTLDVRFYYLGQKYVPGEEKQSFKFEYAQAGQYMILKFLRFEAP